MTGYALIRLLLYRLQPLLHRLQLLLHISAMIIEFISVGILHDVLIERIDQTALTSQLVLVIILQLQLQFPPCTAAYFLRWLLPPFFTADILLDLIQFR